MLESAKQYIEKTPGQIIDQFTADVEDHGMHSDTAKAKMQQLIYAYGQTVANIMIADAQQHKATK